MAPIARADVRLFVLGSLPGDASLAAQRYYAHPLNQFWRLLGLAIGEELHALDYHARLGRLADRRIGLWDVVGSAERRGSLDQAIRAPWRNAIAHLPDEYPDLQAIAFNGSTAAALGRPLLAEARAVTLIDLPSSSPANTRPLAEKAAAWSRLAAFVGTDACPERNSSRK